LNRNTPCALCDANSFADPVEAIGENDDLRRIRMMRWRHPLPSRFQRRLQRALGRH
jgi:hypothetical protein